MATKTVANAGVGDNRAKLLEKIKKHVREYSSSILQANLLQSRIFAETYAYVETFASIEGTTRDYAIERLAASIKKGKSLVESWAYYGQFMREHGIPAGVSGSSIRAVYAAHTALPRHKLLKAVDMVKRATDFRTINGFVQRDPAVAAANAIRDANKIAKRGATKAIVRAQSIALGTLAEKWHKKPIRVYVCDAKTDDILIETE